MSAYVKAYLIILVRGIVYLGALLGLILFLSCVYEVGGLLGVFPHQGAYFRTAEQYSKGVMREMAILLEEAHEQEKAYPPHAPYWGPFDERLIKMVGGDSSKLIDPMNRDGKRSSWRIGPKTVTDRGAWIRVKGLDYWYTTDGKDFWALVSRGPDGDLDVTSATLAQLKGKYDIWSATSEFTYDVSNGTVSSGDIVRIKE